MSQQYRSREQANPDPNEPVINQIKFYLERYRIKDALELFFEQTTFKLLAEQSDFMWEIIPIICRRLRGLCQYRFRVFEGCEKMLWRIAIDENCNPKEVLIILLSELSQQDDDNVFRAIMRPLEETLLRLNQPSPRDENLRWTINVLMRHINNIELPQEYDLDGDKRLALPNDVNVKRFIEILPLMLNFMDIFNDGPEVDELYIGGFIDDDLMNDNSTRGDNLNTSITAILSIMYQPLAFLDLTSNSQELRMFANKCLNTLLKRRPNLFSPIYKRLGLLCSESTLSIAVCSYIYRSERVVLLESIHPFPQVIALDHLLTCHVPYIVGLLERSEVLVHEKGLILLESLLKCLPQDTLDQNFLDMFENSSLLKQIFRVIVFSPLRTNRRRAYEIFTQICDLLTYDCKFKMFKFILTQDNLQPCIKAVCVDQYRKHLTNIYKETMNLQQDKSSKPVDAVATSRIKHMNLNYKAIGGQVLVDILELCIKACLPDLQHTDLMENYELILATLTMFRFLKLRKTAFTNQVEEEYLTGKRLNKLFFNPLRNAITLIIKDLKIHHTKQDETDCLSWALCRVELVESVLVRTSDLYNC